MTMYYTDVAILDVPYTHDEFLAKTKDLGEEIEVTVYELIVDSQHGKANARRWRAIYADHGCLARYGAPSHLERLSEKVEALVRAELKASIYVRRLPPKCDDDIVNNWVASIAYGYLETMTRWRNDDSWRPSRNTGPVSKGDQPKPLLEF